MTDDPTKKVQQQPGQSQPTHQQGKHSGQQQSEKGPPQGGHNIERDEDQKRDQAGQRKVS